MAREILLSKKTEQGLRLDPRTKLLLIFIISIFVMGGTGGEAMGLIRLVLCTVPAILLLTSKQCAKAVGYIAVFSAFYAVQIYVLPHLTGILNFLVLFTTGFFCRILPSVAIAAYAVKTTTVSELISGMERIHIDNGATGTNFHRPGFQQMLSDIEAGHVNCVIVKDLSRLGRNTIDTGYYIEQYFRIRSIRFIAVNENFDTAAPEDAHSGIIIPLRNMINEAYALDIGRKIRAQQRQAMKDGKFIGARTPYGYLKAEDDCHQLIIDPVAAVVVQRMFRWASEGAGLNTIAVRLNEEGILTPSHYKKRQGKIHAKPLLVSW